MKQFKFEISIAAAGLATTLALILFGSPYDLSIVVSALGLFVALSTAAIRNEVSSSVPEKITLNARLFAALTSISNEHWLKHAHNEIHRLSDELQNWAGGTRKLSKKDSIHYQVELLKLAKTHLYAIHIVEKPKDIEKWMKGNDQSGFGPLIKAQRGVPKSVQKRRIVVLCDALCTSTNLKAFCDEQVASPEDNGLGFELKVILVSMLRQLGRSVPADALIVDNIESVEYISSGDGYLQASVQVSKIRSDIEEFDKLWEHSQDPDQLNSRHLLHDEAR